MRILFDYRPALRTRTGVGEFAHGLATALQASLGQGDSLAIFSSSWKDRLPVDAVPGAVRVDARIPVRALNYAWHRLEWPPCEWLAGAVDITHALHPLMIPARAAARFVTIHDLFFLDHPDQTRGEIRRDYGPLAASHARRADGIVVPSDYTRGQVVERLGIDPSRITVCPIGAPDVPRRARPTTDGPILFVGTIEPRKNLPGLLKAYAMLVREWPEAPDLVVAGRLSTSHALMDQETSRALTSRVHFAGYVTEAEKHRLYGQAVLLVMPSLDEGFGVPALEAMARGVPVVASRRGSLPEVLGEAAIFVEPEDPASIAAGMRAMAGDAALRDRMADAGVRRAQRFRWATGAARVLEAYRAALERGRPR